MADLYSLVKKQDEKIDDLLKTAKENKDLLTGIDTRLASAPERTSGEPAVPDKIQVELPESIATNESVKKLVEAALVKQKVDALKSLDFSQFPKEIAEAFVQPSRTDLTRTSLRPFISVSGMSSQARLTDSMNPQSDSQTGCIASSTALSGRQFPNGFMPLREPYCLSLSVLASGATISIKRTINSKKSNGFTATSA